MTSYGSAARMPSKGTGRSPSRGGRSPSKSGGRTASKQLEDKFAEMDFSDRQKNAGKNEEKWRGRLETLLGQPLRPDCIGLRAAQRRQQERAAAMQRRYGGRLRLSASETSLSSSGGVSPMATAGAQLALAGTPEMSRSQAKAPPKYVGSHANALAKAMSIDRIQKYREESSIQVPTLRRVLTYDDSIDVSMACEMQEVPRLMVTIRLSTPMEVKGPEAAREHILAIVDEDLHSSIGKCRSLKNGQMLEVTVLDSTDNERVIASLEELGPLKRSANVSTATLLTAMQFDQAACAVPLWHSGDRSGKGSKRFGSHELDTNSSSEVLHGGRRRSVDESQGRRGSVGAESACTEVYQDGEDNGSSYHNEDRGGEENGFDSLKDAIATWDARLMGSSFFRTAYSKAKRAGH